jgi:hypothetical protein
MTDQALSFQNFARSRAKFFPSPSSFIPGAASPRLSSYRQRRQKETSCPFPKLSFVIAAAIIGAVSVASFAASAKPFLGPPAKPGCIGCNPNTWTPGNHHNNHWNGGYGGYGGFGLNINLAEPVSDAGDCYYVRRQVFIPQVGVVSKRQLVCN